MNIPVYHVDAFTDRLFAGNPAMVCVLEKELPDVLMQTMATEHGLPVTAFIVKKQEHFDIRWFTPQVELALCGHGSLAAGHIVFTELCPEVNTIALHYPNGRVQLRRSGDAIEFDFPVKMMEPCPISDVLREGLGADPCEVYRHRNERCIAIFSDEEQVAGLVPNMHVLKELGFEGLIITAPGKTVDFVSRVFYPAKPVPEDAVTGSSHCLLVPYWSSRLNKKQLEARQVSLRGGSLRCELSSDHIVLRSKAITYMKGMMAITP